MDELESEAPGQIAHLNGSAQCHMCITWRIWEEKHINKDILIAWNEINLQIICHQITYLTWYECTFRQKKCLLIRDMGVVHIRLFNKSHSEFYFRSVKLCDCNYRVAGIWQDLGVFQTSPFPPHPSHSARQNKTTDAPQNNHSHATGPTAALIQ